MGYSQPSQVLATIRGWHHGRYPAVRSPRARELLTEVQPLLVTALAETADPDRAFASFDTFLAELPAGVQLFSLLRANPSLLRLVADIMGTAPRLARILSRRRRLLDAVLDPRTFACAARAADELDALIAAEIGQAQDFQEMLDRARVVGSEQIFLIGVRVLSGGINANQAGGAYALLAERLIAALQGEVERELERAHGRVAGRRRGRRRHGQARRARDDGVPPISISSSSMISILHAMQSDGAEAAVAVALLCALHAAADLRALGADGGGDAVRGRHAAAALGPEGPGRDAALGLRRLSDQRGLDVGASGADAGARHHGLAGAQARGRGGDPHASRAAPRDRAKIAADVLDMRRASRPRRAPTTSGT